MTTVLTETFDTSNWRAKWDGWDRNGYLTASASEGARGYRQLFRVGSHYGADLRRRLDGEYRNVEYSFDLNLTSDWQTVDSGKLGFGVADFRWKDESGRIIGYGNRPVVDDGFSVRLSFGAGTADMVAIKLYYYHKGMSRDNGKTWGDTLRLGYINKHGGHVKIRVRLDFDAGTISGKVGDAAWVTRSIEVSDRTAVTHAWINAYHGGKKVAATKCAADVDTIRMDTNAVAVVSPVVVAPTPTPTPTPSAGSTIPDELRAIADRLEA